MDITPYTGRQKRWVELAAGVPALVVGLLLLAALAFALIGRSAKIPDSSTIVVLLVTLSVALLLTFAGFRLVFSRARPDGGLFGPLVLCVGGIVLLSCEAALLTQGSVPVIGGATLLFPALACFVLAWRRWRGGQMATNHSLEQPAKVGADDLVAVWRRILVGDHKSWVLFRNGTCVIFVEPTEDLRGQALALMREWGPVHVGTPAGDFRVIGLKDYPGWVVACHHRDILTYVAPDEIPSEKRDDLAVGLYGRSKRANDASALSIVHVEDKRTTPSPA